MTLSITDRALDQIESVASDEEVDLGETLLRVAVVPGGCSGLTYDLGWETTVKEDDEVEEHNGVPVVFDTKTRLYLDGSELDFTHGLNGDGFHFSNPPGLSRVRVRRVVRGLETVRDPLGRQCFRVVIWHGDVCRNGEPEPSAPPSRPGPRLPCPAFSPP
jgi:Iron-sulfur cluster assembly accessory protein